MNSLIDFGTLMIFIGFIIVFFGVIYELAKSVRRSSRVKSEEQEERKTEVGGVIFLGPIPIIFGSSKNISKWMLVVAAIITIVLILLYALPYFIS
ncbi:TIGR00304 family membrane protein [Sulfuracidifex metallicus]|nr:DUF131 domain-containing protein [Sulfuracidifex metallicus]